MVSIPEKPVIAGADASSGKTERMTPEKVANRKFRVEGNPAEKGGIFSINGKKGGFDAPDATNIQLTSASKVAPSLSVQASQDQIKSFVTFDATLNSNAASSDTLNNIETVANKEGKYTRLDATINGKTDWRLFAKNGSGFRTRREVDAKTKQEIVTVDFARDASQVADDYKNAKSLKEKEFNGLLERYKKAIDAKDNKTLAQLNTDYGDLSAFIKEAGIDFRSLHSLALGIQPG